MDLGLKELTDDQAIALLQEVLQELATRDPFVRNIAQKKIVEESEKLDIWKAAAAHAIDLARKHYIAEVRKEIFVAVQKEIANGTVRPLTAAEEAEVIAAQDREARATAGRRPWTVPDNSVTTSSFTAMGGASFSPFAVPRNPSPSPNAGYPPPYGKP